MKAAALHRLSVARTIGGTMSNLKHFKLSDLDGRPPEGPLPGRLIAGTPEFRTWSMGAAPQTFLDAGLWLATPGTFRSIKQETWEIFTLLEGVVEITEDGHPPVTYRAGDTVVLGPGFTGVWNTVETVRKVFVLVDASRPLPEA